MPLSPRNPELALAACIFSVVFVVAAFVAFGELGQEGIAWALVVAALLLSVWWQGAVELEGTALEGPSGPARRARRLVGVLLAALGAYLCFDGTRSLLNDWASGFGRAWVEWFGGTVLLSVGLDLAWARWRSPRRSSLLSLAVMLAAVVGAGMLLRLGTFYFFPAPYHVTQVEELQVGAMGMEVLGGSRHRWEFLSQAWLGALGITLGGPTLLSTRMPSTVISFLKIAPLFLWLRFSVGNTGAVVGSLLLAFSIWDTTFARVSTNHDVLVVITAFALLAGPARRGRPSAYVWLGLLSGYVFYEYVLYRPMAVFAVAGAFVVSLRDRHAGLVARLVRPLLTLALVAAMTVPLYGYLTRTGRTHEFFDGVGRARANRGYYNPDDSWDVALGKRLERARNATSLFFFRGAESPVSNPRAQPLIDPFTSLLLVIGTGYALAHPLRQIFGLTLAAALATLIPALVVSGNFDYVRAGSALGYIYALTGFGAAGLAAGLQRAGPPWGRRLATAVLGSGVILAGWFSVRHLRDFVTDPTIQRAQFRDLAYLSSWMAQRGAGGERLIVAAPNFAYLMEGHDAAWMRGETTRGAAYWDIHSALTDLLQHPEPSVIMVYGGPTSRDLLPYLQWLLPSIRFTLEPGPIGPAKDLLHATVSSPPDGLADRLARWHCQPVEVVVELLDAEGRVAMTATEDAGVIDSPIWPGAAQLAILRMRPQVVRARSHFSADFRVDEGGKYLFPVETYPGTVNVSIDGRAVPQQPLAEVTLASGLHHLDLRTEYDPYAGAPVVRLFWQGPDSGGQRELVPFYRISPSRCL